MVKGVTFDFRAIFLLVPVTICRYSWTTAFPLVPHARTHYRAGLFRKSRSCILSVHVSIDQIEHSTSIENEQETRPRQGIETNSFAKAALVEISRPQDFEAFPDHGKIEPVQSTSSFSLDIPSLNLGRALVIVSAALYGSNFAAIKMLDEIIPLADSAAMRFSLGAAALTVAVLAQESESDRRTIIKDPKVDQARVDATLAGVEVGAWYCAAYLCQAVALATVEASKSAFFSALAVIVVPILDCIFRGREIESRGIASILCGIMGVALIQIGPGIPSGGLTASMSMVDLYCLGQAVFFGVGYWRLESAAIQNTGQSGRLTVGQLLGVAGGSILFALASSGLPSMAELQEWLTKPFILQGLLWTGLVSTALPLFLETVALKVVSATELTILMTSVTLWGCVFAYFTIGELLPASGVLGGMLILGGCLLTMQQGDEHEIEGSSLTSSFPEIDVMQKLRDVQQGDEREIKGAPITSSFAEIEEMQKLQDR